MIRPVQVGFPLPAQLARLGRPLAERGRQATATAADGVGCIGGPETGHGVPGTSLAIACLRLALWAAPYCGLDMPQWWQMTSPAPH